MSGKLHSFVSVENLLDLEFMMKHVGCLVCHHLRPQWSFILKILSPILLPLLDYVILICLMTKARSVLPGFDLLFCYGILFIG